MKEENKVTDTLAERGRWMRVGIIPIHLRPLTLLQVQEISEQLSQIDEVQRELDEKEYQTASCYFFKNPNSAKRMLNALVCSMFRGSVARFLFGWYVKKKLTSESFKHAFANINAAFDYNFFLVSLIFLQGTTRKREKTENQTSREKDDTRQATRRGGWLEA